MLIFIVMICGFICVIVLGDVLLKGFDEVVWFGMIKFFSFGLFIFDIWVIVFMSFVMLVIMVEFIGMFLVLGKMVD